MKSPVHVFLLLLVTAACQMGAPDYRSIVEEYADTLLAEGRDNYGAGRSPLVATTLIRDPVRLPEGAEVERLASIPRERWGIRSHDRMLSGANPMHDQNLYQVLYALSAITGDSRYAGEADNTLRWFFENCQSETTALMAWGEHIGWDFQTETIIEKRQGVNHEFFRPWVLWERSFALAPQACLRFGRGLWDHQIADHESGDFSRHARYDQHEPGTSNQYPRHGGFFIATWAEAYERSPDETLLTAIETLVGFYERNRDPVSGAIPGEIGNKRSQNRLLWPQSNLSLAIDLWDGAAKVPAELGARMKKLASGIDAIYERIPHRVTADGEGFVVVGDARTLEATDVREANNRVYSDLWATGYGQSTDAMAANICYLRYRQTGQEIYRDLVLAAADRYVGTGPDLGFPLYPGTMGDVIFLMLAAHELTGNEAYLGQADSFARQSVALFLEDGRALPKASSEHDHYEAITRADTLMMALLKLWVKQNRPELELSLVWCDR